MVKLSLTVKIPELFALFSHKHKHHKTNIHITNIFYNISQFKFYFTFFSSTKGHTVTWDRIILNADNFSKGILGPKLVRCMQRFWLLLHKWVYVMTLRRPAPVCLSVRLSVRPSQKLNHWHFLRHYGHNSHETWHISALWQGLSKLITLSDLHPRSRPQGLIENLEKFKHWHVLRHYDQYSHATWHKGTFLQGHSGHTSLSDLHPRSQSQGLVENLEKHWNFFQHYPHYSHKIWQL